MSKELSARVLGLWGSNCTDRPDDLVAPQYINHQMPDVDGGVSKLDLAHWSKLLQDFHQAFSDVSVTVLMQIAEGDFVATRWQLKATHTGNFRDLATTGRTVSWTGVHTDRYESGKLVESWVDWDKYQFLAGLGLA